MEEAEPPPRDRIRLAALVGALASAAVVAAFFLPWIHLPAEDRMRIREAIEPDLRVLRDVDPSLARGWEVLLATAEEKGSFGGIDLYVWSRSAVETNEALLAQPGLPKALPASGPEDLDRAERARRAFRAASFVLPGLPIASLLLFVHFVAHGFRRARSPTLILLTIVGVVGGVIATAWYVVANNVETVSQGTLVKLVTGHGLRATLVAGFAQAACGVFGVTGRNWWRVYVGALATLAALAALAWAYVWVGIL